MHLSSLHVPLPDVLVNNAPTGFRLPTHPSYEVTQDGVFTVVKRTAPLPLSRTYLALMTRWLRETPAWLPLLSKFMKSLVVRSPLRCMVFVFGKLVSTSMDTISLWSETNLDTIVRAFSAHSRRKLIAALD